MHRSTSGVRTRRSARGKKVRSSRTAARRQAPRNCSPKRMFWGTDLAGLNCTYRQAVTLFTEEIPWLTQEYKEWIMGRG